MRCLYCETEVVDYPSSGICPRCGGRLPPKPVQEAQQPVQPVQIPVQSAQIPVQPVYIPMQPPIQLVPGANCCPKCCSTQIVMKKRGFRWGLAIFGFFFVPVFGLLLGFCGSKKIWGKCAACGHKWKRH